MPCISGFQLILHVVKLGKKGHHSHLRSPCLGTLLFFFLYWPLNHLWFGDLSWFELGVSGFRFQTSAHPWFCFSDFQPGFGIFKQLTSAQPAFGFVSLPDRMWRNRVLLRRDCSVQFAWGEAGVAAGNRQVYCILQMSILTWRSHGCDTFVSFFIVKHSQCQYWMDCSRSKTKKIVC